MNTKSLRPTASIFKPSSHLTFVLANKSFSITKDDAFFSKAVEAFKKGDWDTVVSFVDRPQYLVRYSEGRVKVVDGAVLYDEKPLHGYVVDKILAFMESGLPIGPIVRFLDDLQSARNEHVKQDLYMFLEKNDLPITEDGGFLAYKLTTAEGRPYYQDDGKTVYQVDKLMEMPYEDCDPSRDECSGASYYFARKDYWSKGMFDDKGDFVGDGKMFLVKIMPSWVVSVPVVENGRKGKAFKMLPIMEYSKAAKRQEAHVKEIEPKVYVGPVDFDEREGDDPWLDIDLMGSGFDSPPPSRALTNPKRDENGRFAKVAPWTKLKLSKKPPFKVAMGHGPFKTTPKFAKAHSNKLKGRVRKVNAKGHVVGGKNYRGANGRFI